MRRGRDLLFEAMESLEIAYLFGNPGTTELPVVDGCNNHPKVQYVMALHEDIAVGMAMGYARATGKVGVVNLHVAPGLAHGLGNLYNAQRAGIPLVVTAGQQHTRLLLQEPMLTGDLVAIARPFTKWAYEIRDPADVPMAIARAFKEAMTPPCGPVFLSLPADVMLAEVTAPALRITRVGTRFCGDPGELRRAAELLAGARSPLIVAGDGVGLGGAAPQLARLAQRLGAPVATEAQGSLVNFPSDHSHWIGSLSMDPAQMRQTFADVDVALLCGFTSQAPFPTYDDGGPLIPPTTQVIYLHSNPWEIGKNYGGAAAVLGDIGLSLETLLELVAMAPPAPGAVAAATERTQERARRRRAFWDQKVAESWEQTPIAATRVAAELAAVLPPDATVANEAVSNAAAFGNLLPLQQPGDYWGGKGGGLGHSLPAALGIKLAQPQRTVVNVVGDGTFLYYPQALWTAAHLNLPVLTVVLSNGTYQILKQGLKTMGGPWADAGVEPPGLNLTAPAVDVLALAASFGVAAERVTRPADLRAALERGLNAGRPYVVDVVIAP